MALLRRAPGTGYLPIPCLVFGHCRTLYIQYTYAAGQGWDIMVSHIDWSVGVFAWRQCPPYQAASFLDKALLHFKCQHDAGSPACIHQSPRNVIGHAGMATLCSYVCTSVDTSGYTGQTPAPGTRGPYDTSCCFAIV